VDGEPILAIDGAVDRGEVGEQVLAFLAVDLGDGAALGADDLAVLSADPDAAFKQAQAVEEAEDCAVYRNPGDTGHHAGAHLALFGRPAGGGAA